MQCITELTQVSLYIIVSRSKSAAMIFVAYRSLHVRLSDMMKRRNKV